MKTYTYESHELYHYSSPYYDPQKAHEYYEKHKRLKGRKTSTTGLNEEGRKVASYVKDRINEEKTAKLQSETESRQKAKQTSIEQHSKMMTQKINSLKKVLERIPKDVREAEAPKIKAAIYKLREENKNKRSEIEKRHRQALTEATESIRNEADSKYESELSKIQSESKYRAVKKTKSS